MKILKYLGLAILAFLLGSLLFLFGARFADGPMEIVAGGPFRSGELSPAPESWAFLRDRDTLEFQTLEPARSRTVWLAVHEDRLFLVSGYMNSGLGAVWKQWPHYLEEDDRIILRIDGELYEQRLQRIMEGPEVLPVLEELNRKYGVGEVTSIDTVSNGDTWMFEVLER